MKLPSSRFMGRPPSIPECDRFGLPYFTLIGESKAEMEVRVAAVYELATNVFETVSIHLGSNDARLLFAALARSPKKRGKSDPDRDSMLLSQYDAARWMGESSIYKLARSLFAKHGSALGNSAAAVEAHIRRLKKQRERKRERGGAAFEARRLRMEIHQARGNSLIGTSRNDK
jgi:hypothetical protein